MADKTHKHPQTTPGTYYTDMTCIDCDLCRETAPSIFKRDDEGFSYVSRQPQNRTERELANEALQACPIETIGDDG